MILKGLVSSIDQKENKAEITLPEYENQVTKPLSIYGGISVKHLTLGEMVIVMLFNNNFDDGIILKIINND